MINIQSIYVRLVYILFTILYINRLCLLLCILTIVHFVYFTSQSDLLLVHPVVMSYLRGKWKKYLAICYFLNLGLYLFFLTCLTTFALTIHTPLDPVCKFEVHVHVHEYMYQVVLLVDLNLLTLN